MLLLSHVPVTLEQSSFILPQIFDHKQDAHIELWCSNLDFSLMLRCGISSSLTLQPNNNNTNHPFNNDIFSRQTLTPNTGANFASQVDDPDIFLDPASSPPPPPPPLNATIPVDDEDILASSTASDAFTSTTVSDEFASRTATDTLASPTTSDEFAEETKLPHTHDISVEEEKALSSPPPPPPTTCQVNVANPSCVPVVPSFIGPRTSSPTVQFGSKPDPGKVSNEAKNTAGYGVMDVGTVAVIAIFSVLIVAMFLYWLLWHCHLKQRAKQIVGPYYYGSDSSVGGGGSGGHRTRSTRRPSSLSPNSNSSPLSPPPLMRANRIIPPWSLTFVGDTNTGNSHYEEESAGGNSNGVDGGEGGEEEGQAPSQGPPYHISSPVLVGETSFSEQCSQALELPFNHPHATDGISRPVLPALMDSRRDIIIITNIIIKTSISSGIESLRYNQTLRATQATSILEV
ncbi:MAG: hypothetical protein J3R72DRAFT_421466 [Linnemannia gamsii]|nr:MAG: hypothetical protein J3R72DRAFT_421466 [Linnemannia gamsii]